MPSLRYQSEINEVNELIVQGAAHARNGERDKAIDVYRRAFQRTTKMTPDAKKQVVPIKDQIDALYMLYHGRAVTYGEQRKWREAIADCTALINLCGESDLPSEMVLGSTFVGRAVYRCSSADPLWENDLNEALRHAPQLADQVQALKERARK